MSDADHCQRATKIFCGAADQMIKAGVGHDAVMTAMLEVVAQFYIANSGAEETAALFRKAADRIEYLGENPHKLN